MIVLSFDDYKTPATALAQELNLDYQTIKRHRFPDGESMLQLPETLPSKAIICQTLHSPNDKLIELLLAAKTAREQGVTELMLVAPYLCYMRQDKAFAPGQAVSQKIIGAFLADLFEHVVTVDPHLHRIHSLDQAIPTQNAVAVTAAELLGDYALNNVKNAVFIGPDEESEQWVKVVAKPGNFDYVVATKTRYGDKSVAIQLPTYDFNNKTAVLVDDVISSGFTMAETAKQLKQHGCKQVIAMCTHALLAPGAEKLLEECGVDNLISTDSIKHSSNQLPLAPVLAKAIKKLEF